jgi:hypothetical protein
VRILECDDPGLGVTLIVGCHNKWIVHIKPPVANGLLKVFSGVNLIGFDGPARSWAASCSERVQNIVQGDPQ